MNPQIITTVAASSGVLVALWSIMSSFDKRNRDRFGALQMQIRAMQAELQLEIRGTGDRRVVQK